MYTINKRNVIEIWEPRYKTNSALVAHYKIHPGDNFIRFTKAKYLLGKMFTINYDKVKENLKNKTYTVQANGKTKVICIPMGDLQEITDYKIVD